MTRLRDKRLYSRRSGQPRDAAGKQAPTERYKTISWTVVCFLACLPPSEVESELRLECKPTGTGINVLLLPLPPPPPAPPTPPLPPPPDPVEPPSALQSDVIEAAIVAAERTSMLPPPNRLCEIRPLPPTPPTLPSSETNLGVAGGRPPTGLRYKRRDVNGYPTQIFWFSPARSSPSGVQ